MDAKHTPGPWTAFGIMPDEPGRNPNLWIAGPGYPNRRTICLVHRLDEYAALPPDPIAQADAAYILRACNAFPALLAACEAADAMLEQRMPVLYQSLHCDARHQIKDAISQARGA